MKATNMNLFRSTLWILLPFLAMTEGGAMFQRLVNVPLWQLDMGLMQQFQNVGFYFLLFTPIVLIVWIIMVITSFKYHGKGRNLLFLNHIFYLIIIVSTVIYFIPFLGQYVGIERETFTKSDKDALNTWAIFSLLRQILGFIVIAIYAYMNGVVNKELKE